MFKQIATPALRQILLNSNAEITPMRNAATKVQLRNTMDDLPIPHGSWETNYKAQQTKYNMHLGFGIIFSAASLIVAKAAGVFDLYITPPALPRD